MEVHGPLGACHPLGNIKPMKWSEVKSLSCVRLFATPWIVAYQAPLSMGFSRQEYWSGLPFPSPGHLPDIELVILFQSIFPSLFTHTDYSLSYILVFFHFYVTMYKNSGKESACQCRRPGFDPWVGKIPWRREPTPVLWPGEFHGLYSPWGCKESDMTERLSLSFWNCFLFFIVLWLYFAIHKSLIKLFA